jgi:predicted XRE-type DNA-binding protein
MSRDEYNPVKSSGNIYADLDIENSGAMAMKAQIVIRIAKQIKSKGLTQEQAAQLIKLTQPKLSQLLKGHLTGYTIERLLRYADILGERFNLIPAKKVKTKPIPRFVKVKA